MRILEAAKPAIIICTRDRARATAIYRDTLGLAVAYEYSFAAVFNVAGETAEQALSSTVWARDWCGDCRRRFSSRRWTLTKT